MDARKSTPVLGRRELLKGAALAPLLFATGGCASRRNAAPPARLDIHVHLFGDGNSGSGCRVSDSIKNTLTYKYLVRWLNRLPDESLDHAYLRVLSANLEGSGLDAGVILAQDAVYDRQGRRDDPRTHLYVPNGYLLDVCDKYPNWMIPCVSINPDRRDCIEELERCAERGTRILKIHPPIQGVDISDRKHARFFGRCHELGVIVMVHTGHEHSAPVIDINLADPRRLRLALDTGCRVVASHAGTGWPVDKPDMLPHFLDLLRRYDLLWGDTSILCAAYRRRDLLRLREAGVVERLVHGSDFPFPSVPKQFEPEIGAEQALQLQNERNVLRRDLLLKEALGLEGTAERTGQLLGVTASRKA